LKILLDENFPLALYRALVADGENVHDEDFLFDRPTEATVVISRVRQSRRLSERVDLWRRAVIDLLRAQRPERRFELMDDGSLLTWEEGPGRSGKAQLPSPQGGPPRAD
jgi:hypothetical protein